MLLGFYLLSIALNFSKHGTNKLKGKHLNITKCTLFRYVVF